MDETTASPPAAPLDDRLQLAGMALRNGVLVLGPSSWAVAIRGAGGAIDTTFGRRPASGEAIARKVPLLRGPVALANMLRVLPRVRRVVPDARLAMESPPVLAGVLLGTLVTGQVRRRARSVAVGELASGALSLAVTLASMRSGEVAAYHGAEHKAIGGYEQGISAAAAPREHPRCGTQLALPMLVLSALATQVALAVAPRSPGAARTAGQLIGIAAATELFRAGARGRGTVVATSAARAGMALQTHATTVEPSRAQLDVAKAALDALLAAEATA
jgi:uncharacterized protein YqhQ